MTPASFDARWAEFKAKCVVGGASPEQVSDMKLAFTGGMVEMFAYMTQELGNLADDDVMAALTSANKTLRGVSTEIVKEGFEQLEGKHGQG